MAAYITQSAPLYTERDKSEIYSHSLYEIRGL